MFISDGRGGYINLARVRTATMSTTKRKDARGEWKEPQTLLVLDDGKVVVVPHDCSEEISATATTLIPAAPGFEVLRLFDDSLPDEAPQRLPVVAWRLRLDCGEDLTPDPVTVDGIDSERYYAIRSPEGRLFCMWERAQSFATEAQWLACTRAEIANGKKAEEYAKARAHERAAKAAANGAGQSHEGNTA